MSQKEPNALGLSIKRKIAASRLYGPAPAETNMISMLLMKRSVAEKGAHIGQE